MCLLGDCITNSRTIEVAKLSHLPTDGSASKLLYYIVERDPRGSSATEAVTRPRRSMRSPLSQPRINIFIFSSMKPDKLTSLDEKCVSASTPFCRSRRRDARKFDLLYSQRCRSTYRYGARALGYGSCSNAGCFNFWAPQFMPVWELIMKATCYWLYTRYVKEQRAMHVQIPWPTIVPLDIQEVPFSGVV